jgi:acetyl esterase/lipase
MKKTIKRILRIILVVVFVFIMLMLMPRLIGFIFPEKPPIGYHFEKLDYLAVGVGLEKVIETEPEIPATIQEFKNIEYKNINGKSLQLDLYQPKNLEEKPPLLVFIHGGGWRSGKRSDYLRYLVDYAEKGYVTATVSYRLVKDSLYPACVEDINDAVSWFFNNGEKYGYDNKRIALVGGSAGAHLSLMAAYGWENPRAEPDSTTSSEEHRIKAVVDIYGPVDLTTEYAQSQQLVTGFIGHSYVEKPELYREASPVKYLDPSDPPTLILQGTSDMLLPPSQSDTLKARLDRIGISCTYVRFPLWPHAMDIVQRVNDYAQLTMDQFFEEYLN